MSAIINSLSKLDVALGRLEDAAVKQQQQVKAVRAAAAVPQHDLFNGAPVSNGNGRLAVLASNGRRPADSAVIAKKLDKAIERIEQVLKEG